jgi:hypothetical protein
VSTRTISAIGHYSTDGLTPTQVPAINFDGTNTFNNAAAFYTVPIITNGMDRYRVHFTCPAAGAPVGTLEVQAACDASRSVKGEADATVTDWVDETFFVSGVATTSFAVNGLTDIQLDQNFCNAMWVRLKYTPTSGMITPKARIMLKGDGGR